jgi:hypothetical protein
VETIMRSLNSKLAIVAAVLAAASAFTYWNSVARADRFERGQKLLANLDPDEVAEVVLRKGEQTLTLERSGESFVVKEANNYRAGNAAVNRLLRDLLEIELEREVGSGAELESELGLEPLGEDGLEVRLANAAGQEMVLVRFGRRAEEGDGTFVQRRDGEERPVYLTTSTVALDAEARGYLDRVLVDVPSADVVRVVGPDFELARAGESGGLELVRPRGTGKSSEVGKLASFLDHLQFDKVYLADDPAVAGLAFDDSFRFDLADQSGYYVSVATDGDRELIRITGTFGVERIEIARDSSDEELKEKADVLKRSDEINQFNAYHGSWVYELESFDGDKLRLRAKDLRG